MKHKYTISTGYGVVAAVFISVPFAILVAFVVSWAKVGSVLLGLGVVYGAFLGIGLFLVMRLHVRISEFDDETGVLAVSNAVLGYRRQPYASYRIADIRGVTYRVESGYAGSSGIVEVKLPDGDVVCVAASGVLTRAEAFHSEISKVVEDAKQGDNPDAERPSDD
ncbi:MAG: hypothetical protein ACYTKD_23395 [Planctomycetota bacterium]